MINPLFVPGHPVDNPPTDDYWPHLDDGLEPVLSEREGLLVGPVRVIKAILSTGIGPDSTEVDAIPHAGAGFTDERLIILGRRGEGTPPDRRMMGQFRHEWVAEVGFHPATPTAPARVMVGGMVDEDGRQRPVRIVMGVHPDVDTPAFAVELVHRIARRYLAAGLAEGELARTMGALAYDTPPDAWNGFDLRFPVSRTIALGADYTSDRARGDGADPGSPLGSTGAGTDDGPRGAW